MAEPRPPPGEGHPALRPGPSKLFVEVTSRCNLRCAMCVKASAGGAARDGDLSAETFARLAPALPGLDVLVLNGVGEPLLHPHLEAFVEAARRAMPDRGWVGFQTNAQLLGPRRARSLAAAGVDRVCLSVDAASPELFRALRGGGRHETIARAARALQQAGRARGRPVDTGLEFVVMRENLAELPEVVRFAARNDVRFVIATHMLPYAPETRGAAAYGPSSDRALEFLRRARARAAERGVDLGRYLDVFMRFRPTHEELRIIASARELVAEASAEGVAPSVRRLLRHDEGLRRRVEETFAEATEVARAEGIALRLPEVGPTRAHRCPFVEDGGAFVSWDGGVHPCHFLWHRFSCHVDGLAKHVLPVVHGSLSDRGILEIWGSAAARAFRAEVLRYEFPPCYDCSLALCDYAQWGEGGDCRMGTVPCGACLWSAGVFRCLD